jgi:DNA excision repair protein ERCC-3
VLEEVLRAKKVAGMIGERIDDDTVVVHASERGNLKQALLKLGWPAEDFAGYVDGEAHPIGSMPSTASGTAARASSSSPAAPARPWSGRPRWRTPRPPR